MYSKAFGLLLVAYAVANLVATIVLVTVFGWPDVLRDPAAEVLPRYLADVTAINGAYYLFLATSIVLIPIAMGLRRILDPDNRTALEITAMFGILTGVFQLLGWVRWPFTIDHLASLWAAAPDAATRTALEAAYEASNYYAGVAVGEHLGFLFQAVWTVGVGIALLRSPLFPRWIGWIGIVSGTLFEIGDFGAFLLRDTAAADGLALVFAPAYAVALVWVGVIGVRLLRVRQPDDARLVEVQR